MEIKLRLSLSGAVRLGILLAGLIWCWWYFRSYLFLVAILVLIAGAAGSVCVLWSSRDRITAEVVMPQNRVGRGGSFPVFIRVHNPRRFFFFGGELAYRLGNVFTGYFQEKKEKLWIPPRKGYEDGQYLECLYAGRIEVDITSFVVYEPLHLFCLTGCGVRDGGVVAYPIPEAAPDEEIYSVVEGFPREEELNKRGTDYNPDYEIREYIPGDELKSIHWKLTAKQNRLMVRERLQSGKHKINVLLPLTDDRQENDALVDALYYLVGLLFEKEFPVQLYWLGLDGALRGRYMAEQGELEAVVGEILSGRGDRIPGSTEEQMKTEHPGESYILVETGAYKGAYIR